MNLKLQMCFLVQPREFRDGVLFLYLERWFLPHRYPLCLRRCSWDPAIVACEEIIITKRTHGNSYLAQIVQIFENWGLWRLQFVLCM